MMPSPIHRRDPTRGQSAWDHARLSANDRFLAKVRKSGCCWDWTAGKDRGGYGKFSNNGRKVGAHRFAYELFVGPIPNGMWVLHKCDNPGCVNPEHLFIGTSNDNIADRDAKGRTQRGRRHWNAKLSAKDVAAIRRLHSGGVAPATIASVYETTAQNVRLIVRRRAWRHVD